MFLYLRWRRKVALTKESNGKPREIPGASEMVALRIRRQLYRRERGMTP